MKQLSFETVRYDVEVKVVSLTSCTEDKLFIFSCGTKLLIPFPNNVRSMFVCWDFVRWGLIVTQTIGDVGQGFLFRIMKTRNKHPVISKTITFCKVYDSSFWLANSKNGYFGIFEDTIRWKANLSLFKYS